MPRIALALIGTLVSLTVATPSHATLNACAAGKKKCVSKKTAGLLKCHQLAEQKGLDPVSDPKVLDCLQKVVIKFDGGADPSKGCFAKLEAKFPGGCLTTADTAALENTVDGFVAAVVGALDPTYPAPVTNACSVGKKKCVSKTATALLACHSKNEKPPAGLAPATFAACLQKARDQFDGGADPATGCFAKLEAKFPDCLTTLDTTALETTVDGFVNDVVCQLDPASGTCPQPTATATVAGTPTPTATATPVPVSVDFTVDGYFTTSGGVHTFHPGLPPTVGYLTLPATLTHAELAQLQNDCVDRINMYRSGALKFSDGSSDPGVPKPTLTHLMGNDVCSSDQALGDLYANNNAGGCTGAHTNFGSCPWAGSVGQNTCCLRPATTYSAIRSQLYSCLQAMWDEGIGLPDNAPFTLSNGHWYNMRNASYGYAHCGFAYNTGGGVWMNQDFTGSAPAGVPLTCSCVGKNIGDPDGCGRTCVSAN